MTIPAHEGDDGLPTVKPSQVREAFEELDEASDYVFQLEEGGKTGYQHYQGVVFFSRKVQRRRQDVLRVLKKHGIADAHVEIVQKGAVAASTYCSKSRTRMGDPMWSSEEFEAKMKHSGSGSSQGSRNDRAALREAVEQGMTPEDILLDEGLGLLMSFDNSRFVEAYYQAWNARKFSVEQREVKVHYLWGSTGVGKTRSVYDQYPASDIYVARMGTRDPFAQYRFQKVLVLDEFRSQTTLSELLMMLDRYPYQIDRRYSNSWAAWTEVYILSNWALDKQYPSSTPEDREALERRITDVKHMTALQDDTSSIGIDFGIVWALLGVISSRRIGIKPL